ncbi:unnamed protein product [Urochloa humidicola]
MPAPGSLAAVYQQRTIERSSILQHPPRSPGNEAGVHSPGPSSTPRNEGAAGRFFSVPRWSSRCRRQGQAHHIRRVR